jgi:hypothetical protein
MAGLSAISTKLFRRTSLQSRGMPLLSLSQFCSNHNVIWRNVKFCHCEARSNLITISQLDDFPDVHGLQIGAIEVKFIK